MCYHTGCGIYYHITSGKPMPQILNVCRESIGDAWALKGGGVPTLSLLFR